MIETGKIQIRIDLEGEIADKFEAVKKDKGLENNTDVVRSLITDAFKKLQEA
jgi:hypothetical protein